MSTVSALLCLGDEPIDSAERTWSALDDASCDTIYVRSDFTLCAAIAARTSRARICCLTRTEDPRRVAEAARTLQYLSSGRFLLGLGPMADDIGPYGPVMAAERVADEVAALAEPVPITVFGAGAGPSRLAAQLAEGWLTTAAPAQFHSLRDQVDEWCRNLSRTRPLRLSVAVPAGVSPDEFATMDADEVVCTLDRPLASTADAAAWLDRVHPTKVR